MKRDLTSGEVATTKLQEQIADHAPERPTQPWTCPVCNAEVPGGRFFCDHADNVFSTDMRPRIARRG